MSCVVCCCTITFPNSWYLLWVTLDDTHTHTHTESTRSNIIISILPPVSKKIFVHPCVACATWSILSVCFVNSSFVVCFLSLFQCISHDQSSKWNLKCEFLKKEKSNMKNSLLGMQPNAIFHIYFFSTDSTEHRWRIFFSIILKSSLLMCCAWILVFWEDSKICAKVEKMWKTPHQARDKSSKHLCQPWNKHTHIILCDCFEPVLLHQSAKSLLGSINGSKCRNYLDWWWIVAKLETSSEILRLDCVRTESKTIWYFEFQPHQCTIINKRHSHSVGSLDYFPMRCHFLACLSKNRCLKFIIDCASKMCVQMCF